MYRETNCLVDGLANYAFYLSLGFYALNSALVEVDSILREDVCGPPRLKQVRM